MDTDLDTLATAVDVRVDDLLRDRPELTPPGPRSAWVMGRPSGTAMRWRRSVEKKGEWLAPWPSPAVPARVERWAVWRERPHADGCGEVGEQVAQVGVGVADEAGLVVVAEQRVPLTPRTGARFAAKNARNARQFVARSDRHLRGRLERREGSARRRSVGGDADRGPVRGQVRVVHLQVIRVCGTPLISDALARCVVGDGAVRDPLELLI